MPAPWQDRGERGDRRAHAGTPRGPGRAAGRSRGRVQGDALHLLELPAAQVDQPQDVCRCDTPASSPAPPKTARARSASCRMASSGVGSGPVIKRSREGLCPTPPTAGFVEYDAQGAKTPSPGEPRWFAVWLAIITRCSICSRSSVAFSVPRSAAAGAGAGERAPAAAARRGAAPQRRPPCAGPTGSSGSWRGASSPTGAGTSCWCNRRRCCAGTGRAGGCAGGGCGVRKLNSAPACLTRRCVGRSPPATRGAVRPTRVAAADGSHRFRVRSHPMAGCGGGARPRHAAGMGLPGRRTPRLSPGRCHAASTHHGRPVRRCSSAGPRCPPVTGTRRRDTRVAAGGVPVAAGARCRGAAAAARDGPPPCPASGPSDVPAGGP